MKLYQLEVTLQATPVAMLKSLYEFVASDDEDARTCVGYFSRVCQPINCGPLMCVGEKRNFEGIEAICRFDNESDHRVVPLEIQPLEIQGELIK
jgi:hypothetical protein